MGKRTHFTQYGLVIRQLRRSSASQYTPELHQSCRISRQSLNINQVPNCSGAGARGKPFFRLLNRS